MMMLNLQSIISSVDTTHLGHSAARRPGIGLNRGGGEQRHGSLDAEGSVRDGRGWARQRSGTVVGPAVCLPRWMDNRSQCSRARPTPMGRLFVIGFTWRSLPAVNWKCSGGKLLQSLPSSSEAIDPFLGPPCSDITGTLAVRQRHAEHPAVTEVDTPN